MCGRFILGDSSWADYHEALSVIKPSATPAPSFNIKPTQTIHMVYDRDGTLRAEQARWWFVPSWHKGDVKDWKATTFNARIEDAHQKPTWRGSWSKRRCIIPATGYYEWTGPKGQKQPWYIAPEQNVPVFFFAGLYAPRPGEEDPSATCAILTRAADPEIEHLHHRMPVVLKAAHILPWLKGEMGTQEAIDTMGLGHSWTFHEVQKFGIADDEPHLIEPSAML